MRVETQKPGTDTGLRMLIWPKFPGVDDPGTIFPGDLKGAVVGTVIDHQDVIAGMESFENATQTKGVIAGMDQCSDSRHEGCVRSLREKQRNLMAKPGKNLGCGERARIPDECHRLLRKFSKSCFCAAVSAL